MKQIILDSEAIRLKIKRMATQVVEQNYGETELVLLGITDRGYYLAELLVAELKSFAIKVHLGAITLNKVKPLAEPIQLSLTPEQLQNKSIIIVDDVANSGQTLFYALKPLMDLPLKKLQVAVLVDRQHKQFPIAPDIIGYSLSTTLQERIDVEIGASIAHPQAFVS